MDIKETINGTAVELIVIGRLDTLTAPQLEARVRESAKKAKALFMDLSQVEYISSAGLRVVLLAHKLMIGVFGNFIVKNPSPFCCQVFEATGMDGALNIEK